MAGALLFPLVGMLRASLRNDLGDVLWLEEHGEEQRGRILPPRDTAEEEQPEERRAETFGIRVLSAKWREHSKLRAIGRQAVRDGFTISEFEAAKLLSAALIDQAEAPQTIAPDETVRLQSARVRPSRE